MVNIHETTETLLDVIERHTGVKVQDEKKRRLLRIELGNRLEALANEAIKDDDRAKKLIEGERRAAAQKGREEVRHDRYVLECDILTHKKDMTRLRDEERRLEREVELANAFRTLVREFLQPVTERMQVKLTDEEDD